MTQHQLPTPEETEERQRRQEALTLQLADDVRNILIRLFQRAYQGQPAIQQALNNCMHWLPLALDANGVEYEFHPNKGKINSHANRGGQLRFHMHEFAFEIYNFDLHGDTRNHQEHPNQRGNFRDYLGNMIKLRIFKIAQGFHKGSPELRMQWLAADIMTSAYGMPRDQFDQWGWAFPRPIFCTTIGDHKPLRDWLMLAKQSLGN